MNAGGGITGSSTATDACSPVELLWEILCVTPNDPVKWLIDGKFICRHGSFYSRSYFSLTRINRNQDWGMSKLWKTIWLHHSKIHNDSWQQNQQFHQCRDVLNIHILIAVIKRRWNRSRTYLLYQWQIVWFYFLHIYMDFALRVQVVFATKEMNRILEYCQVWQDQIFFLYIKAPIQAGKIWNFPNSNNGDCVILMQVCT